MTTGRISKRSVDALSCPDGKDRGILWDDDLAGFGVIAFPSGAKTYIVQYRQNGQSHRCQIGKHGRLTPDEARSEAKKLLGLVETGFDPVAIKKKAREAPLLNEVAEDYLKLHVSMADTNCTRWRRKTVPVWLIEKGAHAPGLVRLVCCAL